MRLPAEATPIPWFGGKMSNTFFTTLIIDALFLLLVGLGLRHARRGDVRPPKGILGGMVEMISEALGRGRRFSHQGVHSIPS